MLSKLDKPEIMNMIITKGMNKNVSTGIESQNVGTSLENPNNQTYNSQILNITLGNNSSALNWNPMQNGNLNGTVLNMSKSSAILPNTHS